MKQHITFIFIISFAFAACEKTTEQKKDKILENELENRAIEKSIIADSLKSEADVLLQEANRLERKAKILSDSAKKL